MRFTFRQNFKGYIQRRFNFFFLANILQEYVLVITSVPAFVIEQINAIKRKLFGKGKKTQSKTLLYEIPAN